MTAAFDTLKFAETLKSAGIPEKEAKAFTEAFTAALQEGAGQWATKQDLKNLEVVLKQDIQELDARLNARIDRLEAELKQMTYKLTVRLGGMLVLGFSVLAVLIEIL